MEYCYHSETTKMLLKLILAELGHYVRRNVEKFSAQHISENLRRAEKFSGFPGVCVCLCGFLYFSYHIAYLLIKNFTGVHMKLRVYVFVTGYK